MGRALASPPYPCANCASVLVAGATAGSKSMGAWVPRVGKRGHVRSCLRFGASRVDHAT
ncbi:hypothetical protein PF008_g7459 [Phytophthora fragariae]|uniref:Uncharacterized protein n=1 Tax=Phytophthora fragariae TaxID=53985 RepID=A0A6G0S2J0_9STRA|nr:hypothetical protein PF008_g7459 [Phytophthora fragariae]